MSLLCGQCGKFRVCHDFVGENVGFARFPLFHRQKQPVGKVAHIAEVKCAFQPHRDFAAHLHQQTTGNRAAGGIAGAKNAAGHDDTGIQTGLCSIQHKLAGHCLTLAVNAKAFLGHKAFRLFHPLTMRQFLNGSRAAHIDELFAFRVGETLVDNVLCALHVDFHDQLTALITECYHTGAVQHDGLGVRRNAEKALQRGCITQIALALLDFPGDILGGFIARQNQRSAV